MLLFFTVPRVFNFKIKYTRNKLQISDDEQKIINIFLDFPNILQNNSGGRYFKQAKANVRQALIKPRTPVVSLFSFRIS
jgi:hypothetical protein